MISFAGLLNPRRIPFWLLLGFLAYTLAGFFLAPWLIERAAISKTEELGRTLTAKVTVNPFVLSIRARDTEMRDTDGAVLFSYDEYYWNFQLSSLFNRAWTFREIALSGFYLNLERFSAGDHRFGRLIDSFPEDERNPESTGEAGLPRLIIHDLILSDGRLAVTDHVGEEEFHTELGPIDVHVQDLKTLPEESGTQKVSVVTEDGGSISWEGSLQITPLHSRGRVRVEGASLSEAHRYLDLLVPFSTAGDDVSLSFDYSVAKQGEEPVELAVDGLELEAHGLVLSSPEGQTLLRLPRLSVNGGSARWPQNTVSLERVGISGPELFTWLDEGGRINLAGLLPERDDETISPPPPEGESGKWQLQVDEIAIDDATVDFQDRSLAPPAGLSLVGMDFRIGKFSSREGERFETHLSFGLSSGGTAAFNGEVGAIPAFSAEGQIRLDDIQMSAAQPYVSRKLNVVIESGRLDADGDFSTGESESAAYAGSFYVHDLEIGDAAKGERLAAWSLLDIDHAEFSLASRELQVAELELRQPYARVHIAEDLTTNIGDLVIPAERAEAPQAPEGADALAVTVGKVAIDDAGLDFSDHSLPLPFSAAIRSMGGEISTISTTSSQPAEVSLEGQVNEYGQASIDGSINAWAFKEHTDIAVKFRNLEMSRLTPYTIRFAGHAIEAGKMDLDLDYRIAGLQLEGKNKVVIREIALGEKVEHPGAASLPLGLAVALLKDSEGVIDIDLPVAGDLGDPEFSYGGVVAKALFNLITKIVASPFRLLGNLVGVDSEDFGTLEFRPGDAGVSPPDREKLVKLTEAMSQRPGLTLEVTGVYAPLPDRAALREQHVDAMIEAGLEAEEAAWEQRPIEARRKVVEALYRQVFPEVSLKDVQREFTGEGEDGELDVLAYVAGLRQSLVDHQQVGDEELISLGQARAAAVLAILSPEESAPIPQVAEGGIEQVEAGEDGAVPLELKVSVEDL